MEFVRGHETDYERLPALRLCLSMERVVIEFMDESLSSCQIQCKNLFGHLVVRLCRSSMTHFYFGVESVRVPNWKDFEVLDLKHRNKIIDTVASTNTLKLRVKNYFLNFVLETRKNTISYCRQVLGTF
jgi:hypothetical protein